MVYVAPFESDLGTIQIVVLEDCFLEKCRHSDPVECDARSSSSIVGCNVCQGFRILADDSHNWSPARRRAESDMGLEGIKELSTEELGGEIGIGDNHRVVAVVGDQATNDLLHLTI